MQSEKVWDFWEVDALSLLELREVLGNENSFLECQGKIEFMKELQKKGLFTWNLPLEFETLMNAYGGINYDKEWSVFSHLHEHTGLSIKPVFYWKRHKTSEQV